MLGPGWGMVSVSGILEIKIKIICPPILKNNIIFKSHQTILRNSNGNEYIYFNFQYGKY